MIKSPQNLNSFDSWRFQAQLEKLHYQLQKHRHYVAVLTVISMHICIHNTPSDRLDLNICSKCQGLKAKKPAQAEIQYV